MTQEDYTAICKRFIDEIWNRGELGPIDELVDAGFTVNGHEMGREGLKESVLWWRAAFPDIRLTIEELLIDGDRAGIWYSARGTHNGEFIGMAMFSPKGVELLRQVYHRVSSTYRGGSFHEAPSLEQASLTDMLQELIDQGQDVYAVNIYKGWMEVDTFEDYQRAWAYITK
jgi:predicted ester cyclase